MDEESQGGGDVKMDWWGGERMVSSRLTQCPKEEAFPVSEGCGHQGLRRRVGGFDPWNQLTQR